MKEVVLLDNYDSFTYNLVQYLQILGAEVKVFRNDEISVEDFEKLRKKSISKRLLIQSNMVAGRSPKTVI